MIVGLGFDLVDIERAQRMYVRRGAQLLTRLFTEGEATYAMKRGDPVRHLAARLAAKEATYKALAGNALARAVGWREIEVVSGWDGAPALALHGRAAERAAELGVTRSHVALSHSALSAGAVVILED